MQSIVKTRGIETHPSGSDSRGCGRCSSLRTVIEKSLMSLKSALLVAAFGILLSLIIHLRAEATEVGSFATYKWTPAVEVKSSVVYKTISPEGSVTYRAVTEPVKATKPFYITYSVIKKEGDRYYWMQITTKEGIDSEPLAVTKIKIDRKKEKVVRALVKSPKSIYRKVSPFDEIVPVRLKAIRDARQEEITILGKSYMSIHGMYNNIEIWVSKDVPVTGIIKAVMADGVLELVESGYTKSKR